MQRNEGLRTSSLWASCVPGGYDGEGKKNTSIVLSGQELFKADLLELPSGLSFVSNRP